MPNSIDPIRELSLKYDKISNNLYDAQNIYNKKINTNTQLIEQNMKSYDKQEVQNNSLKIILLAFFIIMIVVLLYRIKVFDSIMILSVIIVAIIILAMLLIYYSYYLYDYQSYIDRASRNTANKLSNNTVPIGNELDCDTEEESNIIGNALSKDSKNMGASLQSNYNKLLKNIDSNFDVWTNGDHISKTPINENNVKNVDLDANAYRSVTNGKTVSTTDIIGKFNGLPSNTITYEQCEYIGANHNGMPLENKYMYSSIPCKYYINYKSNGKFIKDASGKFIPTSSGL